MLRDLLNGYLILLLVSFVGVGHRYFQIGVLCVWLGWHLFRVTRWSHLQGKRIVWAVPLSQFPGMVTVVLSLWGLGKGGTSEWANALLEVWVYPFSPILESVPTRTVAGLSLSYLAACAVPFLFALMTVWWWRLTRATS